MCQLKQSFNWLYLVQAEDSTTPAYGRWAGVCKTFMWLAISILLGIGMSQLT